VADEWTADILMRDLMATYRAILSNAPDAAAPSVPAFAEYTRWRHERASAPGELRYWARRLSDVPFVALPTDWRRPADKTYRTGSVEATLPVSATDTPVWMETTVLAAFQTVLSRYSRHTDITVGARVSLRGSRWPNLVGNAANTVALRTELGDDPTSAELVTRTRVAIQEAHANSAIPFGTVVDELNEHRDLTRTPFFSTMFHWRDGDWTLSAPGLAVTPHPLPAGNTAVDLALTATTTTAGLHLRVDYNADLYRDTTAHRFLTHLVAALDGIADPNRRISAVALLTDRERRLVLEDWNATSAEYPSEACLHHLVESQVRRTPRDTAVTCGGISISYGELNDRANHLAHYLRTHGIRTESRVALCLNRSVEMVTAMLAVLKAGGTYVPLDPEYPRERLAYLLSDSTAELVITQSELGQATDAATVERLLIDEDWAAIAEFPRTDPEVTVCPDNLAYMIYTSGSTGLPKGVMVSHRGAVNNLTWRQRSWPLTGADRVLQNHSFSFDPSLWAIFWPLTCGARTVITLPGQNYDSKALIGLLRDQGITVYCAVPSMQSVLMEDPDIEECTELRYVHCGGEPLTGALQKDVFRRVGAELINFYGPTETTVDSTAWVCERTADPEDAPIGRPVANLTVHILDDNLHPTPIGLAGHICVGGVGLARGYHDRPGLTADRFVPDPFGKEPGGRLYRTGDLGRYREDGAVEFLGRVDDQVKIRGHRVELGEVEAAMTKHPLVVEAVAIAAGTPETGDSRLIGYVRPAAGNTLAPQSVHEFLTEFLPSHLVPTIVVLDEFPRTPNGKIDRRALPAPEHTAAAHDELVAPRSPLEAEIAELFATSLRVPEVGVTQDFFELGGSSLTLSRLAPQITNRLGVTLPVHVLFRVSTVEGVAETVRIYQRDNVRGELGRQQLAASLEKEAVLAEDITPAGLPEGKFFDPDAILVTGATGYLGAYLLEELLLRTDADIYCLVRATDADHARNRLQSAMRSYSVWHDEYADRIVPLVGDLDQPRLGVSEATWNHLSETVDLIYHSGAKVNFVYPYSALRRTNVWSTQELLRLACTRRLKAFHYVSTIDVSLTNRVRPMLEDETALETLKEDPGGYTSSKWVAEKVVNIARKRGVPVRIYRPAHILGHSETGATLPDDYIMLSFRGFAVMGVMPEYKHILDAVPIDYVAKAIAHISLNEDAAGDFYHLYNPAPVSVVQFLKWARTFGYEFDIVDFEEARQQALQVPPDHPLYPMVPVLRDGDPSPQPATDPELIHLVQPELESRNTLHGLRGSDISCPPLTEEHVHLVLRYLIENNRIETPEDLAGRRR
jgi:amino acid adenylation domain-containing protein/thioester reductase-like protein